MKNTKESLLLMAKAFRFYVDFSADITLGEMEELENAIKHIEDELSTYEYTTKNN